MYAAYIEEAPMTLIYLAIAAAVLALTVWNLWTEKDWRMQCAAAMVALPLLLRVLLIK
jgi:hypothetical protein